MNEVQNYKKNVNIITINIFVSIYFSGFLTWKKNHLKLLIIVEKCFQSYLASSFFSVHIYLFLCKKQNNALNIKTVYEELRSETGIWRYKIFFRYFLHISDCEIFLRSISFEKCWNHLLYWNHFRSMLY